MRCRIRRARFLLVSVLVGVIGAASAADGRTEAVLKLHELSFTYRGHSMVLSCGDIEGRVASVLVALGARPQDLYVKASGCDELVSPMADGTEVRWGHRQGSFDDRDDRWDDSWDDPIQSRRRRTSLRQSAHVQIRAMMPVEATPAVMAEIHKDRSRRELIARVRGERDASMLEPIVFPAERRQVTLSRKTLRLEPEECELMEQISRSMFKQLGVRVVRRSTNCGRDVSHIPPQLVVEALLPALPTLPTFQDDSPQPAAEEGDAD